MPIYSPLDQFSPRRSVSNLQHSKKHRNKPSGQGFYCLMYVRGFVSHQDKFTRLTRKLCFSRATGQQNPCFLTEEKALQVFKFSQSVFLLPQGGLKRCRFSKEKWQKENTLKKHWPKMCLHGVLHQ